MVEHLAVSLEMQGVGKVLTQFGQVVKLIDTARVKSEQSAAGFKKQYAAIQESIKPLGERVRKTFQRDITLPSLTAEQAIAKFGHRQRETAQFSKELAARFRQQGRIVENVRGGFRRFHMELLSVMFGAMMVSKALLGLVTPALTAVGAFELWKTTLELLYLDTAIPLLNEFFVPLLGIVNDLDPGIKKAIGGFTLLGGGMAKVLETGAQIGLFAFGIKQAHQLLAPQIPLILDKLKLLSKALAIGIGFYYMYDALKELKEGEIKEAISSAASGMAFLAIAGGKLKAAGALIAIKIGAELISVVQGEKELLDSLTEIGLNVAMLGIFAGTPWAIGIGVSLMFIKPLMKFYNQIKDELKTIEGISKIPAKYSVPFGAGRVLAQGQKAMATSTGKMHGPFLPEKQTGGYIPHTGLYKLHAGESVNQAGANTFNNNIVVHASSNVDIEMLKRQLSTEWNRDLAGLGRR